MWFAAIAWSSAILTVCIMRGRGLVILEILVVLVALENLVVLEILVIRLMRGAVLLDWGGFGYYGCGISPGKEKG